MSSYLITGVSRGIGFELLRQTSANPANIVIGLVRDKEGTETKVASELKDRKNVHILRGDMTDYDSLQKAVADTAAITGGSLDYVFANAVYESKFSSYSTIAECGKDHLALQRDFLDSFNTNVFGNVHLFNLVMPLVLKGKAKKVITISSGMADIELVAKYDVDLSAPYSMSKGAMNVAVAKFSAVYAKQGVLFMSICPGVVDTGHMAGISDEQMQAAMGQFAKFQQYAPHFKGPDTPEDSVKDLLSLTEKSSVANGDGGAYISHLGGKKWL